MLSKKKKTSVHFAQLSPRRTGRKERRRRRPQASVPGGGHRPIDSLVSGFYRSGGGRKMMYASQEIPHRVLGTNETTSVDGKKTEPCCSMAAEASRVLDDDNLLREILVRVGFPTTLVCATLVCKRWYHHASEPAFLCRFRKLNPPRLLGFYVDYGPYSVPTTPCFVPMPFQAAELAAVVRRVSSYSFSHHDIVGSRIARTASSPPHCSATKAASSSRGQMIIGFQLLYTLS